MKVSSRGIIYFIDCTKLNVFVVSVSLTSSFGERQKCDEGGEDGSARRKKEHVTELKHLAHGVGVSWPRGDY